MIRARVANKRLHPFSTKSSFTLAATKNISQIFPSMSVIMDWVLHLFMTAMAMEKMDIIETGCGVHIVMAAATENIEFVSLFRCHYCRSVNEP